jgi:hypothetical protein
MTSADLGPAELITLVFPGERADPRVAEVLAEVAAGRDIRVLDLVFVTRTSGNLVRITGARENLDDTGLGALQLSTPELIGEDDLDAIRDFLRPGTSAAVVAYEHGWARRLAQAVRDAGGMVLLSRTGHGAEEWQADAESKAAVREAELMSRLADLARLRESGALSTAEFEAAKARLLAS